MQHKSHLPSYTIGAGWPACKPPHNNFRALQELRFLGFFFHQLNPEVRMSPIIANSWLRYNSVLFPQSTHRELQLPRYARRRHSAAARYSAYVPSPSNSLPLYPCPKLTAPWRNALHHAHIYSRSFFSTIKVASWPPLMCLTHTVRVGRSWEIMCCYLFCFLITSQCQTMYWRRRVYSVIIFFQWFWWKTRATSTKKKETATSEM